MPDRLIHRTWSIRTISNFATPFVVSPTSMLKKIEDKLTQSIKHYHQSSSDGTYVSLSWLNLSHHKHQHMLVEVFHNDIPKAQLCFCIANYTDRTKIHSFCYILIRGSKELYNFVVASWECEFGCKVGISSVKLGGVQIGYALSSWLGKRETDASHDVGNKHNDNKGHDDGGENRSIASRAMGNRSQSKRPLEIIYSFPSFIADRGLESITLTIPPLALTKLTASIPKHHNQKTILIKKALQCFISETFNLDLSSCAIIKASMSDYAVLGHDGRIKFVNVSLLGEVLQTIGNIISEYTHASSNCI